MGIPHAIVDAAKPPIAKICGKEVDLNAN